MKKINVIEETSTGRNKTFKDLTTGTIMTRAQFVKKIEQENYPDYHVRLIDGIKTPVSNPNGNDKDNLG
ncbi:hypothetical protein [Fusobacterium sp. IOR10]|uniref:hypothetical protein n=1 Tax=Fusobacterium sp. IOR10 TaxID=2665157 RepID=UPI00193FD9E4|nr:hypothetical protein [Fusobacterium sp. IOR10]